MIDISNKYIKTTLTEDQQKAATEIIDFIAQPFDENKLAVGLIGAGGTGKTYVMNYIINHCIYASSVIKCTSPTNKACRVFSNAIGGKEVNTIQSTFGLRLNLKLEDFDPIHPQFDPMGGIKLENIKLLIIDEASMLPARLTNYICKVCKNDSIKIIFLGDNDQLSPVGEKKSIAFDKCYKIHRLTEIVRQTSENPISKLLKLLRKDIENKTYTFINYIATHVGMCSLNDENEGFMICNNNEFLNQINNKFHDPEYVKNIDKYRIVAYTNAAVTSWNNYIRNIIIQDYDKGILTKNDLIMSYNTIVNEFLETIIVNSEEYIVNDIVNYVDSTYGFKGYLVKFQAIHGGGITKPLFLIDHKDNYSITAYYKIVNQLQDDAKIASSSSKASKWKDYYNFKKKYLISINIMDITGKIIYPRDIDYGFAITAHKSQGSTYNTVFIDLNDMIFTSTGSLYANQDEMLRRLYVACSRAKTQLIFKYDK